METEKKTAEETIYEMVGIKPGADKLTPMDYGEAKACMEMFAAQELAEYKARLKEAVKTEPSEEPWSIEEIIQLIDIIDKL